MHGRSRSSSKWRHGALTLLILAASLTCGDDSPSGPGDDGEDTAGVALAAEPASISLARGQRGTVQILLTRVGGYSGTVSLTVENVPAAIDVELAPSALSGSTVQSSLDITVQAGASAQTHTLRVRASGPDVADATVDLSTTVLDATAVAAEPGLIATGATHTCAVGHDGDPLCWGSNGRGQLGDAGRYPAQFSAHRTPIVVQEAERFTQFAAGEAHTCAIDEARAAWCWGLNQYGQIGDGTSGTEVDQPVAVLGGRTWSKLVAGTHHTCGLETSGAIYCWGGNFDGQLGDGSTANASSPVQAASGVLFGALSASASNTCALSTEGDPYCWGTLFWSTEVHEPTPVDTELSFATFQTAPNHACGLVAGGAAYCIGRNHLGQIGDGTTTDRAEPSLVLGELTFATIAVGSAHSCGVTAEGEGYCWGSDLAGEVGDGGGQVSTSEPALVDGGQKWRQIVPSSRLNLSQPSFTCGITIDDLPYCWGANTDGQLGNGTLEARTSPAAVAGQRTFEVVEAGLAYTCGLVPGGQAFCFGRNAEGQLGTGGTASDVPLPEPVAGGLSFVALDGGRASTCGLDAQGNAWCWGSNGGGELGNGSTDDAVEPVPVAGGSTYAQISVGRDGFAHTCAITTAGSVECWGYNDFGQLGDGGDTPSSTPLSVDLPGVFAQVVTGLGFTCALRDDGVAYCWGYNQYGQLGNGAVGFTDPPGPVTGGHEFERLTARDLYVCASDVEGAAWCWGRGNVGQLGAGDTEDASVPTAVVGGHTFRDIVAGGGDIQANLRGHTCAIDTADALWCWGYNHQGQVGDASTEDRTEPVAVLGGHAFESVSPGGWFTCGVTTSGHNYCWGDAGGQFGDGNPLGSVTWPKRIFY